MSSKHKSNVSPDRVARGEKRTQDSVDADPKEIDQEEPSSKMDQLLAMLMQSNLDAKLLREELREQREQSRYDIDRLYRSTSNLEKRMNVILEDLEKRRADDPAESIADVKKNTSPNRQIVLDGDDDAETSREKVFRPAIKESPIGRASDESPDEEHFFMDSANYGFQKRFPEVKLERREPDHSRRESKVISDMKYNIQRTESQSVYKTVTAEPFTKKLTKIDITHFLSWYTNNWNDHMVTSRTYTEPTNLVSISIREILCENNDLTLEDFHALRPEGRQGIEDFLQDGIP
jgi:hypothetical protein